ncbi:MAG TPA: M23 family metallopeptidase [Actinoplanes sp.]|nr:M23 family metallopeptidase [Actinoplanes sp.]
MTGPRDPLRRPRRVVILIALVGVLALLCCGGAITALLVGEFEDEPQGLTAASFGCGAGGPVDATGEMPRIGAYGETQLRNAAIIINVGADLNVPPRGWVIAVATAMQESRLSNLGHLGDENDHDSLGLFQQRPSSGWGTPAQVRDPRYAATKFYQKLLKVRGWQRLPLTVAAQRVQISAYPDAYAKHEPVATQIVNVLADGAARAVGDATTLICAAGGEIAASGWTLPWAPQSGSVGGVVGSGFRTADRPSHQGVDLILGRGMPVRAATSGIVTVVKCNIDHRGTQTCDVDGWPGKGGCGWMVEVVHSGNVMTRYCHLVRRPTVRVGQRIAAGQLLGHVGSSGNSSGPHLHFEVHLNNDRSSAGAVDPVSFMRERGAPLGGAV